MLYDASTSLASILEIITKCHSSLRKGRSVQNDKVEVPRGQELFVLAVVPFRAEQLSGPDDAEGLVG